MVLLAVVTAFALVFIGAVTLWMGEFASNPEEKE